LVALTGILFVVAELLRRRSEKLRTAIPVGDLAAERPIPGSAPVV